MNNLSRFPTKLLIIFNLLFILLFIVFVSGIFVPFKLLILFIYAFFVIAFGVPIRIDFFIGLMFICFTIFPLAFKEKNLTDFFVSFAYLFFVIGSFRYLLQDLIKTHNRLGYFALVTQKELNKILGVFLK